MSNCYTTVTGGEGTIIDANLMKSVENMPNLKFFASTDGYPVISYKQGTRGQAWTGHIAYNYASGNGTKANPYIIETAEQLVKLIEDSNTAGKYYTLAANIIINDTVELSWFANSHKGLDFKIIDEEGLEKVLKGEEPITIRPGKLIPQADFDKDRDYKFKTSTDS